MPGGTTRDPSAGPARGAADGLGPFAAARREMLSLRSLEDGWDGEGSERPSEVAVTQALLLLGLLPHDVPPPEAAPADDGTVDWFWRSGRNIAVVTFFKDGAVAYSVRTDGGEAGGAISLRGPLPGGLVEGLRRLR